VNRFQLTELDTELGNVRLRRSLFHKLTLR